MKTSIATMHKALLDGTTTVVKVVSKYLDNIEKYNHKLSGYNYIDAEAALNKASMLDKQLPSFDGKLPPLFGIPYSVKDNINVAGMPTSCSSHSMSETEPPHKSAVVVNRMENAGAICLGKANCHEFAFGGPSFDLPTAPATNPWKEGYFPGGSSSGSGTTVAGDMCMASLGTDTAGSIRSPSAYCGLVGLKPTYGNLPLSGVHPLSISLDHVGPLANSVDDCWRIYKVMSGSEAPETLEAKNKAITIGVPEPSWGINSLLQPDMLHAYQQTINSLKQDGVKVIPIRLPNLQEFHVACAIIMMAEVAQLFGPLVRKNFNLYGEVFRNRALVGERINATAYIRAIQTKLHLQQEMDKFFNEVDAIMLPGAVSGATALTEVDKFYFLVSPNINAIANVTGQPVVSLPIGMNEKGLPLGIQLLGKRNHEQPLFSAAAAIEKLITWRHHE